MLMITRDQKPLYKPVIKLWSVMQIKTTQKSIILHFLMTK